MVASYRKLVCGLAAALFTFAFVAADARAQTEEREPTAQELSTARSLFRDGIAAEKDERWEDALELFSKVATIAATPLVHYHVGLCSENTGRLVEAINAYQLSARGAKDKGDEELAGKSQERVEALEPTMPRVIVLVPDDAIDVSIEVDGKPMAGSLVGTAVFVNPGERKVVVRATNYADAFEHSYTAVGGETQTIEAELGDKVTPQREPESVPVAPEPVPTESEPNWIVLGVGIGATVAFGVVAAATGVVAHGKFDDYETANEQPAPGSLKDREAMRDDAITMAWVSTGFTAGAILAGAATVVIGVIELTPTGDEGATEARVGDVWVEIGAGGATVGGHF